MPKLETISSLGLEHVDQRLEQQVGVGQGREARQRDRAAMSRIAPCRACASASRSSARPAGRHAVLVGDRQRMVGQRHVEPRERAPASRRPCRRAGPRRRPRSRRRRPPWRPAWRTHRPSRPSASRRSTPSGSEALRRTCAAARPRPARGCRRRDRRRCRRRRGWRRARPAPPSCLPPRPTGFAARSRASRTCVEEGGAVRRLAHRGGGDGAGADDLHLLDQQAEARERGERPRLAPPARSRRSRRRPAPSPAITFSLKMTDGMRVAPE